MRSRHDEDMSFHRDVLGSTTVPNMPENVFVFLCTPKKVLEDFFRLSKQQEGGVKHKPCPGDSKNASLCIYLSFHLGICPPSRFSLVWSRHDARLTFQSNLFGKLHQKERRGVRYDNWQAAPLRLARHSTDAILNAGQRLLGAKPHETRCAHW